jgi:hypothetical protein
LLNNRQNGRRRGRGGGPRTPNNAPSAGNRQDNRSRGNAVQLHEKYKALARDAQLAGDRVQTEYFLQFADHYFRVLNENRARFEEQRPRRDDFMSDEDEDQDDTVNASEGEEQDEPEERDERPEQRQERQPRFEREERGERGENRPRRQRARRDRDDRDERPAREEEVVEERISLDSLPPAISVIEGGAEEGDRAPRRRTRRPRPAADEADIAPAA